MPPAVVPLRNAVPLEHTWNAQSVFPSHDAWDAAFQQVAGEVPGLRRFQDHLGDGPETLAEWFTEVQRVLRALGHVVLYANLGHSVDTTDQDAAARHDRARGLAARVMAAIAFADPEMIAIGFDTLRRWVRDHPKLALYAHYIERLERRAAHVRSAEVEELLNYISDPFRTASSIHGTLADADLTFAPARVDGAEPLEVAQGTIGALMGNPDREVRRTAWTSYADAHLAHRHSMANCIAAGVKQNVFTARARRYPSALEASLSANHIPVDVFFNLIETYRRNLPTWHRYWKIRRQALGYDTLHLYDLRAPLVRRKTAVPFEQAVEWISEGMRPLSDEYVAIARRGMLEHRWVDRAVNKGKRAGAFSAGAPGTYPFIVMSYTDDVFGLSTLAHELGHSMHSYYSWLTQPLIYARYGIFLAEVASNFNQAMVRAYLLENHTDPDLQIAVIEEAMGNFLRYFLVMPTLARFELEIHQRVERGEALTTQSMMSLMTELFSEAYGSEVKIDADRLGITWAQFPTHLYSNFYVFQYATGISGAHALAEGVCAGKPHAADRYMAFLKAGGSRFPLDTLKEAGVDLASPEPVAKAFGVLAQLVDRLASLLSGRPSGMT